ncbi:MAG: hypothetical protein WCW27_06330 [Patescibacteria group bacterium]|jgi:hypothetical protein
MKFKFYLFGALLLNGFFFNFQLVQAANLIELSNDDIDNDNDGVIDEVNTVTENGYHSLYAETDPKSATLFSESISSVKGSKNGKIKVTFNDGAVYKYAVFDNNTAIKTIVKQHKKSGYLLTINYNGQKLKLINPYTGVTVKTITLSDQPFSSNSLKQLNLQSKQDDNIEAVITSQEDSLVRVMLLKINPTKPNITITATVTYINELVDVTNTVLSDTSVVLRNSTEQNLREYRVTSDYQLQIR